jgi:hypothetical protein
MKTIIIFLFLCSITFGQYNTYDLIIEYEQECFNDSSLTHTYMPELSYPFEFGRCYKQTGNLAIGYSYILDCNNQEHYSYVHKEPSWDGFREFVKRKYQKLVQPK